MPTDEADEFATMKSRAERAEEVVRSDDWLSPAGVWKRTVTYRDGRVVTLDLVHADGGVMTATPSQVAAHYNTPPQPWWVLAWWLVLDATMLVKSRCRNAGSPF